MEYFKLFFTRGHRGHEKLDESHKLFTDEEEHEFQVRYLGETPMTESNSKKSTAQAVQNMVKMAKQDKDKVKKVTLVVSPSGVRINETSSYCLVDIPLTHVSYCSADAKCSQVFAFVSVTPRGDLKCHAFQCHSKKNAREITTTLNKMFQTAMINMKIDGYLV